MFRRLLGMSRTSKRLTVLLIDAAMMPIALMLALALRLGEVPPDVIAITAPLAVMLLSIGLPLAAIFGIHNIRLSGFDLSPVLRIGVFALTLASIGTFLNIALNLGAPRTVPPIFGAFVFVLMISWRAIALKLLEHPISTSSSRVPVAIYGAGKAGMQLISAFRRSNEFRLVAVVDDSPSLRGVYISGLRVQSPAVLRELVRAGRVSKSVLAMPSINKQRLREIVASLEALDCEVLPTPGFGELLEGGDPVRDIKPVSAEDLLGRKVVDLNVPDVVNAYTGRSVMITGAGGSIGSELCRQVLSCNPRRIILFELNEFALYSIDREIRPIAAELGIEVATVLGSVCDSIRLRAVMYSNEVEIVLHAAAYKHVPLVEENEVEGSRNNVFGTRALAETARELGIKRFILISTDKAVRPTNVMGASKRLAEIVIQDLQNRSPGTTFSMVRFGNVLGSSGSVIPLFRSQIAAGGPITLTHPDVTRYFMTISEAARLVLLAGAYATGGDLFVLDMGKPVKIMSLARRMIEMSGLTVRDTENPTGDIEIETVGLRPGEKLYEELLIDDVVAPTPHPKIMRASEPCPSEIEVAKLLKELRQAIDANLPATIRRQIGRWVEGYSAAADMSLRDPDRELASEATSVRPAAIFHRSQPHSPDARGRGFSSVIRDSRRSATE